MANLKVSIITASYNSAATIEETILSVIGQTYPQIEYIIYDGGSIDGTVEFIKKYEERISFWTSEPDNGIANAWNKGITKCTGDIVGILNADDTYTEDAVEKAVEALSSNHHIDFVFGDLLMYDSEGKPVFQLQGNPTYANTITHSMPAIPHPTVFVRRDIYQEFGGFDEGYKTALDYEFLLRITKRGIKGLYVPGLLVKMKLGGESDTNFIQGYREVMRASVKHGYPKLKAQLRFYYKTVKGIVRRYLEVLGMKHLIKIHRILFKSDYKYD